MTRPAFSPLPAPCGPLRRGIRGRFGPAGQAFVRWDLRHRTLTHGGTTTHFRNFHPIPKFRASLGASTPWLGCRRNTAITCRRKHPSQSLDSRFLSDLFIHFLLYLTVP